MKIKLLHPFNFIIYSGPKTDDTYYDPNDNIYRYGFSLDLTTEIYFYRYDYERQNMVAKNLVSQSPSKVKKFFNTYGP